MTLQDRLEAFIGQLGGHMSAMWQRRRLPDLSHRAVPRPGFNAKSNDD